MNRLKIWITIALLTTISACASIPASLRLDSASSQGLIIVEASPSGSQTSLPEFSLSIARYSDAENRLDANSFGGWAQVRKAAQGADGHYWLIARADPGTYAIAALTHRTYWEACFNENTRAFVVEPGKVVFVGRIDPLPALITMATTLPQSTSTYVYALDQRIALTSASELGDWEPNVRAYLQTALPGVTAPIVAAPSREVSFNTGWDITRTGRVCGGYYAPSTAH